MYSTILNRYCKTLSKEQLLQDRCVEDTIFAAAKKWYKYTGVKNCEIVK